MWYHYSKQGTLRISTVKFTVYSNGVERMDWTRVHCNLGDSQQQPYLTNLCVGRDMSILGSFWRPWTHFAIYPLGSKDVRCPPRFQVGNPTAWRLERGQATGSHRRLRRLCGSPSARTRQNNHLKPAGPTSAGRWCPSQRGAPSEKRGSLLLCGTVQREVWDHFIQLDEVTNLVWATPTSSSVWTTQNECDFSHNPTIGGLSAGILSSHQP
jgi:hypothetical protein